MTTPEELLKLGTRLASMAERGKEPDISAPLDRIATACESIGKAWSGSWLGYHARVYYKDFSPVPPGARFSQEWGFMDTWGNPSTHGEWAEYDGDYVIAQIFTEAGNPEMELLKRKAAEAAEAFDDAKAAILSHLAHASEERPADAFLISLKEKVEKTVVLLANDFIRVWRPSGQTMSRDIIAIEKGFHAPPHLKSLAEASAIRYPFFACGELSKISRRAGSHLSRATRKTEREERMGTNIFIGHGRSKVWKDLRDFIRDRLRLPWDEFNRVPIAGTTNIARLSQMLDAAAFAFLVLTAEDEQADGKLHARMNVVHEAGLFQGRLGFERAIILVEEGCEEFSNIHGLGQIRFPPGDISSAFEEIRRVLEREELIVEKQ